MRARLAGVLLATGCGRIGFDELVAGVPCSQPWSAPSAVAVAHGFGDPSISADDLELFLSDGTNLFVARRSDRTQPFGAPEKLAIPGIVDAMTDPSISEDGRSLYFCLHIGGGARTYRTDRASAAAPFGAPVDQGSVGNGSISGDQLAFYTWDLNTDIVVWRRASVADPFSPDNIANVGPGVDTGINLERAPSIAYDQLAIYFTTVRGGGNVLSMAARASAADDFATASEIPIAVTGDLDNPSISADGHHLYFDAPGGVMVIGRCE